MKVLILGSHGCVGSAVMSFFESKGHTVVPWDIKMGNEYDLRKPDVLDKILPTVDFVLFFAFDVGGSKYNVNSTQYIENNILLMNNTFRCIEKHQKPFIHTTSTMANMNNSPYCVLKRLGEFYTEIVGGINVKLWNVYGSEEISEKSHVINDFIHQAKTTGEIRMRSKGLEERLFLYCDDFAEAIYHIFQNYDKFKASETVDIAHTAWSNIHDVASIISSLSKEALGKEVIIYEGSSVDTHCLKNQPTKSYLNDLWSPKISLEEGIKRIFEKSFAQ